MLKLTNKIFQNKKLFTILVACSLIIISGVIVVAVNINKNLNTKNIDNKTSNIYNNNQEQNVPIEQTASPDEINMSDYDPSPYSNLYPNLYCKKPTNKHNPDPKTVFLTFDDGPSDRTPEILDILNKYKIKATFFVIGTTSDKNKEFMKRIVNEGHTLGIHTYTHDFKQIYSSIESYLEDFNKIYNLIYEVTNVKPTIFRFPGGSKNSFNKNNYKDLINETQRRGFKYYDWNLSAQDAVSRKPTPVEKCISNVLNSSKDLDYGVVLMHDAKPKTTTVAALPGIIEGLQKQGFKFDKLSNEIDSAPYSLTRFNK